MPNNIALFTRPQTPLAITNVAVIPMDRNRVMPQQTVVIENGWIKSIDPANNVNTRGMMVIDGAGQVVQVTRGEQVFIPRIP